MKTDNKLKKYFLLLVLIGMILINSCSEELPDNPNGNSPPNTGVFLYPDSTVTQQPSRLTVRWWGDDPDGLVVGFYFKWEGIDNNWSFTTKNDSTFSLPIGSSDTTYNFLVSAVDASCNGYYDSEVLQNGINYGGEPYVDANSNGKYDNGEFFYDIGLIDPTPASTLFPIKNTSPEISWNELSFLPDTSFPVVTIAWNVSDLDGDESITEIEVALNDTNNFVSLNGSVRLITLRGVNLNTNPEVEILINASSQNIHPEKLQGIILNGDNKIFIRAKDLSGAISKLITLPDTTSTWYVKNPKGEVLIFDDFVGTSTTDPQVTQFYNQQFSSINGNSLSGKFDVFDFAKNSLAFESVTLLETVKLFKYVFWYSGSKPSLDLLNIVTSKYTESGGKIAFTMTFADSGSGFEYDFSALQGFLPINGISETISSVNLFAGAHAVSNSQFNYPTLTNSNNISFVKIFEPNTIVTDSVYTLYNRDNLMLGNIAFKSKTNNLFFIGLPLHLCNGDSANVPALLEKIFFEDFGVAP